jgi:hypothetical protein
MTKQGLRIIIDKKRGFETGNRSACFSEIEIRLETRSFFFKNKSIIFLRKNKVKLTKKIIFLELWNIYMVRASFVQCPTKFSKWSVV